MPFVKGQAVRVLSGAKRGDVGKVVGFPGGLIGVELPDDQRPLKYRGEELQDASSPFASTAVGQGRSAVVLPYDPFNPLGAPAPVSRTDRIAALRQEMRELGAGMLDDALSSAEALVHKLRELAEAPTDAVSDGQRDAAGKLATDLDSRVTTMRQIQGRQP